MENKILPRDFIYDKIFHFSEDQYSEMEDMIIEDIGISMVDGSNSMQVTARRK